MTGSFGYANVGAMKTAPLADHLGAAYANQIVALETEIFKKRLEVARVEAARLAKRGWVSLTVGVCAPLVFFCAVLPSFLWWTLAFKSLCPDGPDGCMGVPVRWWITPNFYILPWAWILIGLTASTWLGYFKGIQRIRAWQDSRRVRYVDVLMNRSEATKSRQCPRCLAPNLRTEQGTCTVCGFALPSV